ncbi:MAG TPA: hypothetical protein VFB36_14830 [Nevskiaceae bacterium]|nr:hypothetical protein [Nevskiaceae bacterium]
MNAGAPHPWGLTACVVLALAWACAIAAAMHGFVAGYFPLADDWSVLAYSHPHFARPLSWFTEGFANYLAQPPGLSEPYTNFLRPVLNLAYWIQGLWLAPESGGYLYFNYVVIAACAGLCLFAVSESAARIPALVLAAALPLMPGLLGSQQVLLFPVMAFDPLAAALCLLAAILFSHERWIGCAVVLLAAALTKETAMPIVVALPLLFAAQQGKVLRARDPVAWLRLAMLGAPIAIWFALRYAAFGGMTSGTYTDVGIGVVLRNIPNCLVQVPFWAVRGGGVHLDSATLTLLANAVVMAAVVLILVRRLLARMPLRPLEICLVFAYAFMLRFGFVQRFGAVMDVFLVACVALWLGERESRRIAAVAAIGLLIGLVATHRHSWRTLEQRSAVLQDTHEVARRFVAALRSAPQGSRVIVVNDPVTWFARLDSLVRVEQIPIDAVKLSDVNCSIPLAPWTQHCDVALAQQGAGEYRFNQSCGIELCGTPHAHTRLVSWQPGPGISAELHPGAAPLADFGMQARWAALHFTVADPQTRIVYFEPSSHDFHFVQ